MTSAHNKVKLRSLSIDWSAECMNEYELEREARIASNRQVLKDLGVFEAVRDCQALKRPKIRKQQPPTKTVVEPRQPLPREAKACARSRIEACVREDLEYLPLRIILKIPKLAVHHSMPKQSTPRSQWQAVFSPLDAIKNAKLVDSLADILSAAGLTPGSLQQMENAVTLTMQILDESKDLQEHKQKAILEATLQKTFKELGKLIALSC